MSPSAALLLALPSLPIAPALSSASPAAPAAGQESRPASSEPGGSPAEKTGPPPAPPLPADVAATIDGVAIPMERYKEHLLRVHGNRELDQLIALVLLEREAARIGVTLTEEELDGGVAADLEVLEGRMGGPAGLAAALEGQGHTLESYARVLREGKRREMLADRICRAQRDLTPEKIQEEFERQFGPGGLTTNVQHLWLTLTRGKLELESSGKGGEQLSRENVYGYLMARGKEFAERVAAGEDFEALARAESHDPNVDRNGGYLTGYEFTRLSRDLRDLLPVAPLGELVGPVRTANGMFLFRVLSRTQTQFEDVEEQVRQDLRDKPATTLEMRALETKLYGDAVIRKF